MVEISDKVNCMAEFVFLSEKGLRENNEDFYGNYKDEFFVVTDGLSGHAAGEVASKKGVETAKSVYKSSKDKNYKKLLEKIFIKANEAILKKTEKNREWFGMATTMLAAVINKNSIVFANVGDCRAYLLLGGAMTQVTSDDRDEVGFLLRALGAHNEDIKPQIVKKSVKPGDIALLCSDGLHDFVKDSVIEKILKSEASLDNKAKGLIDAALQFGSTDNITAGLIKL